MRPRYLPGSAFPPYAYTGEGRGRPHPRHHPEGHSHGVPEVTPPPLDPARWRESEAYLGGIDLFNHGYYWEAHEAWEGLWVAAGKRGPVSELAKGLIKLAAAGVKARQGQAEGVRSHGRRAAAHFREAARLSGARRLAGLDLEELAAFARELEDATREWPGDSGEGVVVVFERVLRPRD